MDKQIFLLINFFSFLLCVMLAMASAMILLSNSSDKEALLALKHQISPDPSGTLSSWNDTIDFCNWKGISCSKKNKGRVVSINLSSSGLTGYISSFIENLTFLEYLDLNQNQISGEIPPSLFTLPKIYFLNLSLNSFYGEIPSNLSSSFIVIDIRSNYITGSIPSSLGHLSNLNFISFYNNSLTGKIPPSLGNISSLQFLFISQNQLEGCMPEKIGNHQRLKYLNVFENRLSGELPVSLFNLSSAYAFGLGVNNFEGMIPATFEINLPNLQYLSLGGNQFKGSIPNSLTNATKLKEIDMSHNNFNGAIPSSLGRLRLLTKLNLAANQLETSDHSSWEFLDALTNCSQLNMLYLDGNKLNGILPSSIANLSRKIEKLGIGWNKISGSIPSGIGNLINLITLDLESNHLIGAIPESIGNLVRLQRLCLRGGMLTGTLPFSIGNLTQMVYLFLDYNGFHGPIPPSIENLKSLETLLINNNNLNDNIPKEVFKLPSILYLRLDSNTFTGSIPLDIGDLKYIEQLYLQNNKLFGEIPSSISNCMSLEVLDLSSNLIKGTIPPSIGDFKSLMVLDISENNLIGQIPEALGMLRGLTYLNLSFNYLTGKVPSGGIFLNATSTSLQGNYGLCGGSLDFHLPACSNISSFEKRRRPRLSLLGIILPSTVVFSLILFFILCLNSKRINFMKNSFNLKIMEDAYPKVSYLELQRATNGFSPLNLLGIGQYVSLYKGSLNKYGYATVAIKVFNLQQQGASRAFLAECMNLRNIRHRNLVKIITCCVGIDLEGNDFMAIVFEFMSNGNLDTWLHADNIKHLDLIKRLDIAIDIANALCYLHHECETPIIHCDLKPSNVLLDDDMVAHVGGFKLARLLHAVLSNSLSDFDHDTLVTRRTVGYDAPEYGLGSQVSIMGDVYSYGIILLELFTGRRVVEKAFKDGLNLQKFVKMAILNRVLEVIDPNLQLKVHEEAKSCIQSKRAIYECLNSILQLSLLCSNESATERISIAEVLVELHSIKDVYFKIGL